MDSTYILFVTNYFLKNNSRMGLGNGITFRKFLKETMFDDDPDTVTNGLKLLSKYRKQGKVIEVGEEFIFHPFPFQTRINPLIKFLGS